MSIEPLRHAVYGRISDDVEQDEKGVRRQLKDGSALVAARGGILVEEIIDNDISALKDLLRPGYTRLMALAERRAIDVIVVWQTSRLWRNRRERADGIGRLAAAGVSIVPVKGPALDLSSAYGRGLAGILGEFDTMESEVKSERIRRKALELAEGGAIAAGGPRPFGYRRVFAGEGSRRKIIRDELDEVEAPIVEAMAKRILGGESAYAVGRWLNAAGFLTSGGSRWSTKSVRTVLRSGRIAGLREHHGRVVAKAVWPAIVTEEEHQQLMTLLPPDPSRRGIGARKHPFTGLVRCRRCLLLGVRMQVGGPNAGDYRCLQDHGGCGQAIKRLPMERMIGLYVVHRLAADKFTAELAALERTDDGAAQQLRGEIDADERRLRVMAAALEDANADVDAIPEAIAALATIRRRIVAAHEKLSRLAGVPSSVKDAVGLTIEEFEDFTMDRKRSLTLRLVDRVIVGDAVRGLNRFDPRRVEILPRQLGR